jgi:hypothetical protein
LHAEAARVTTQATTAPRSLRAISILRLV